MVWWVRIGEEVGNPRRKTVIARRECAEAISEGWVNIQFAMMFSLIRARLAVLFLCAVGAQYIEPFSECGSHAAAL
ncbi:MAG: hypothetical protein AMJ92_05870 [candidate division Zixibacteria bacterium SM23_81]|nr:MAG: hypothetical protein AMJ92_05870 [candidate division Zixibacteria bacterium SM23_81]